MTVNIETKKLIRIAEFVLLVAIFVLLLLSKPWAQNNSSSERTITVSGQSIIKAEPDQFLFSPYYQKTGTDKDALRSDLTKKANTVIDGLKDLGVAEEDVELDASAYDRWFYEDGDEGVLNVSIRVQVTGEELVQKVQDYLLTTSPEGQITPQAVFSNEKQQELDAQAVAEASTDARAKAEVQAKLFDAKLGDVVSINQANETLFGGYNERYAIDSELSAQSVESLPVLPGQDEYTQTVTVIYRFK